MTTRNEILRRSAGHTMLLAAMGALSVAGAFTQAEAQGNKGHGLEVFEAAQQPPPEHVEMERHRKEAPEAPRAARPSVQELVEQIARQRGGKERLEQARKGGRPEHAIAASQRPPPDAAELEKQKPPAPPRSMRPTRQELEQVISRQDGGRGKLDRARQGGRPDQPPPRTSATQRVAEWFAWLPEVIASAHATTDTTYTSTPSPLSVTVTPTVGTNGAHAGLTARTAGTPSLYASVFLRNTYMHSGSPTSAMVHAFPFQFNWDGNTQSASVRPFLSLTVGVPRDGYYIISTRASGPAGIQLRRYAGTRAYPVVQTFDAAGTADRPALVYLTKGYHYFYWVSPGYLIFYSASVYST